MGPGVPGASYWQEALRVAKPGAHLLACGGPRTHHRLMVAIEDAGWELRDCCMWVFGGGFPKSLDVGKAIDKAAGAERKVIGPRVTPDGRCRTLEPSGMQARAGLHGGGIRRREEWVTAPATEAAKQWDGWGTALKPAYEPVILARKPLDGTVAETVLKWGCGGSERWVPDRLVCPREFKRFQRNPRARLHGVVCIAVPSTPESSHPR